MKKTFMETEIHQQPDILRGIAEKNRGALEAVSRGYRRLRRPAVYLAGRGTSDHAAIYAQYLYTVKLGIMTALAVPSAFSLYGANVDLGESLAVAVSQSGRSNEGMQIIAAARRSGGISVAVTNDPDSPMAKSAEHHLFCGCGEEKSVAATKTFTAQMYLLALLCAKLCEDGALTKALEAAPDTLEQALGTLPSALDGAPVDYAALRSGFILSRGMCYPVALEAALKLQETCRAQFKGFSVADFYHGPVSQVGKGEKVILFAPAGAVMPDMRGIYAKLSEIGADTLVFTDDDTFDVPGRILLPSKGNEFTSPFVFAAAAQCLALKTVLSMGLDPDSPRYLKKVTLT